MSGPRRQHYYFAHQYLREKAHDNPRPLIEKLRTDSANKYLQFLWIVRGEAVKSAEDEFIPADGLRCHSIEIGKEFFGALVEFPPPCRIVEAYLVAILLRVNGPPGAAGAVLYSRVFFDEVFRHRAGKVARRKPFQSRRRATSRS